MKKVKKKKFKFHHKGLSNQVENRHAVIINYKKPFLKWHYKLYPWKESNPADRIENQCSRVSLFLCEDKKGHEKWLKKNYKRIFQEELADHAGTKKEWPKKRTYKLFRKWLRIDFADLIFDEDRHTSIDFL